MYHSKLNRYEYYVLCCRASLRENKLQTLSARLGAKQISPAAPPSLSPGVDEFVFHAKMTRVFMIFFFHIYIFFVVLLRRGANRFLIGSAIPFRFTKAPAVCLFVSLSQIKQRWYSRVASKLNHTGSRGMGSLFALSPEWLALFLVQTTGSIFVDLSLTLLY